MAKKEENKEITKKVSLEDKVTALETKVKRLEGLMAKVTNELKIGTPAPKVAARALTDKERVFEAKVKDENDKESTKKFQLSNVKAFYSPVVKGDIKIADAMKNKEVLQGLVDIKSGLVRPL